MAMSYEKCRDCEEKIDYTTWGEVSHGEGQWGCRVTGECLKFKGCIKGKDTMTYSDCRHCEYCKMPLYPFVLQCSLTGWEVAITACIKDQGVTEP